MRGGSWGSLLGYDRIPAYWKQGLTEAEDIDFKYTTISLKKVYQLGYKQALENIDRNGGRQNCDFVTICVQRPQPVRFEQSFPGLYPTDKVKFEHYDLREESFDFQGIGLVIRGGAYKKNRSDPEKVCQAAVYIDGQLIGTTRLPTDEIRRRDGLFWNYHLSPGKHHVTIKAVSPEPGYEIFSTEYIGYSGTSAAATVHQKYALPISPAH